MSKMLYEKPVLEYCGPVAERTLGSGGSTYDGGHTCTQKGQGNDPHPGPHDGECPGDYEAVGTQVFLPKFR